jgi:predicted regulator of Ras-like GTPase activity (Roadblock/LC7/MglB family)
VSTDLNWLITAFAERTPGVAHAALVSADGLPLATSRSLPRDRADQLAAVTAGLTSLMQGASRIFEGGPVTQTVVEMDRGVLVAMGAAAGAALVVLAAADCDLGLVAYEMALLTERTGPSLSPAQRSAPDATGAGRP